MAQQPTPTPAPPPGGQPPCDDTGIYIPPHPDPLVEAIHRVIKETIGTVLSEKLAGTLVSSVEGTLVYTKSDGTSQDVPAGHGVRLRMGDTISVR